MEFPHFTHHGTRQEGDSLDLFAEEAELLGELFAKWDVTNPEGKDRGAAVTAKWDHGTLGKLILEHSAVWLAAGQDVARVLDLAGHHRAASELRRHHEAVRPEIDRMATSSHGVQPINLAISPEFVNAVNNLRAGLAQDHAPVAGPGAIEHLRRQLGEHKDELRSAHYIRRHAPTHPDRPRWYDRLPFAVRVHSAFDRLRGFPWGESSLGDRKLAREYDREA